MPKSLNMCVENVVLSGLWVPWSLTMFVENVVVSALSGPPGTCLPKVF